MPRESQRSHVAWWREQIHTLPSDRDAALRRVMALHEERPLPRLTAAGYRCDDIRAMFERLTHVLLGEDFPHNSYENARSIWRRTSRGRRLHNSTQRRRRGRDNDIPNTAGTDGGALGEAQVGSDGAGSDAAMDEAHVDSDGAGSDGHMNEAQIVALLDDHDDAGAGLQVDADVRMDEALAPAPAQQALPAAIAHLPNLQPRQLHERADQYNYVYDGRSIVPVGQSSRGTLSWLLCPLIADAAGLACIYPQAVTPRPQLTVVWVALAASSGVIDRFDLSIPYPWAHLTWNRLVALVAHLLTAMAPVHRRTPGQLQQWLIGAMDGRTHWPGGTPSDLQDRLIQGLDALTVPVLTPPEVNLQVAGLALGVGTLLQQLGSYLAANRTTFAMAPALPLQPPAPQPNAAAPADAPEAPAPQPTAAAPADAPEAALVPVADVLQRERERAWERERGANHNVPNSFSSRRRIIHIPAGSECGACNLALRSHNARGSALNFPVLCCRRCNRYYHFLCTGLAWLPKHEYVCRACLADSDVVLGAADYPIVADDAPGAFCCAICYNTRPRVCAVRFAECPMHTESICFKCVFTLAQLHTWELECPLCRRVSTLITSCQHPTLGTCADSTRSVMTTFLRTCTPQERDDLLPNGRLVFNFSPSQTELRNEELALRTFSPPRATAAPPLRPQPQPRRPTTTQAQAAQEQADRDAANRSVFDRATRANNAGLHGDWPNHSTADGSALSAAVRR